MKKLVHLFAVLSLFLIGCEEDITVDLPRADEMYVVEGHIEANQEPYWPYILISKNASYFDPLDQDMLNSLIVHDAQIMIDDSIPMYEFCMEDVNSYEPEIREPLLDAFAAFLNVERADLELLDYCIYLPIDFNDGEMVVQLLLGILEPFPIRFNEDYKLTITIDTTVITGYTTIKEPVQLSNVHVASENDTLMSIRATLNDPAGMGDAYRIQYKQTALGDVFISPGASSFDDRLVDGTEFDFVVDFREYHPNDTIIVRLSTIDMEHRQFWRTYDRSANSQGNPFASPTNVQGNLENALGIWGSYSTTYDTIIVADFIP